VTARRALAPVAAVLFGALCFHLSTGLGTFWPAAWVASVGVLAVGFTRSWRVAALVAFAAHFLGSLGLVAYLGAVLPVPVVLGFLAAASLTYVLAVVIARAAFLRLPAAAAVFAFPAAWTAIEFVTALASPHGTFLNLAYSQVDVLPVLQLASVTGLWGVSFLVTLVGSALAVAIVRRSASVAIAPAVALAVALGFGTWRLRTPPSGAPVRVGLAASDVDVGTVFETRDPALAASVTRGYASRVARLASQGVAVVVLPEKMVGVTPADADSVVATLAGAARDARVTLVAGLNRVAIAPPRNVALVYAPDGSVRTEYHKRHLLPGPETGYRVGAVPGLFEAPGARWGVAICKDMDFPSWSRAYGRAGVQILTVPAWDFVVDGRLHSRMAVVRAVENGFALVRSAMEGRLLVTDAYGRVLAEDRTDGKPEALLVASVPPGPGTTFYARTGDWFGWLSLAALAALVAVRFVRAPS
jgi:apolipoprotein N-acyltransferase